MDEDVFRNTYNTVNPNRCIFEKSITNRRCDCNLKRRFLIASREGIACVSEDAVKRCTRVLDSMRNNARFSLKVVTVNGPMPHNKELQVQAGGMLALQKLANPELDDVDTINGEQATVDNINHVMENALQQFGSMEDLPYGEIVKSIVKYQSRPKRRKK
ncbi:MAG: hypothetical protein V3U71_13325 [Cocleimonas sp.]